jgi:hypothetical protein
MAKGWVMGVGNLNVEHKITIDCCCMMYIHASCKFYCEKGFQSGKGDLPINDLGAMEANNNQSASKQ